jgi:electron transport complex protein RnfB
MSTGVLTAILSVGGLGLIFGVGLALAAKRFAVRVDPRVEEILEALPGANCGACGYAGCLGFAQAVVEGKAPVDGCMPGGAAVARELGKIMGEEVGEGIKKTAFVQCRGGRDKAKQKFSYQGLENCGAASLISGGPKACRYGCLGFGDCVKVCPFDAIRMGEDGIPLVDDEKCTGCGLCVQACPRRIITLLPTSQKVFVGCISKDKGGLVRKTCTAGCIGCGICAKKCPSEAITIEDNYAWFDYDKCINCGICAYVCPTKAIVDKVKARPKASIGTACTGCGICKEICPAKAISGEKDSRHRVDMEKCIGCGLCFEKCPVRAISMVGALGWVEERKRAV